MASRLKEDDASGQNKWADIDDDDDDWAPETITWGDGTKTTLPQHEEHPVPSPPEAPIATPVRVDDKPRSPAPPSVQPPVPTKSSGLASGKGLVLKAASQEKPTLVAKPPAPPAPVKSPWATIPTIERASPAAPESSQQARAPPPQYRDMPQQAPKEIAADDFSRAAYRDSPSHGRELFNSNSGLYEPVAERRGSRHDPHARHPAVLQRSHGGDHPAEPSSAFQTHRAGQDHSFGRRRASSNLSGGSGTYFQRGAKGPDGAMPPPDALGARRPSLAGSVESPHSPHVQPVPGHTQHRPPPPGWQQGSSPHHTFATPHQATASVEQHAPPQQAATAQDDVELQQKIMRESREQARKRRLEEEARLEEEKKERIRKKLESLGPAPEKKSEKQETPPKVISRPTQIQQREQKDPSQQIEDAIKELHQAKPELENPTTQEIAAPKLRRPSMNNSGPPPPSARRMSSGQDAKRPDIWSGPGARPERYQPWGPGSQPTTQAVWGAPNNNRGLGNGTFNTDLGRLSDPAGPPGPPGPPGQGPSPIGPPGAARPPSDSRPQPQAPIGSRPSRFASSGSELASKWINGVAENDKKSNADRLDERMQREAQLAERGLALEDAQPPMKDTWRPAHAGGAPRRVVSSLDTVPPPPPNPAGVIGSKNSSVLSQGPQGQQAQGRMSRFFPANQTRLDAQDFMQAERSSSPSPPPPMMEDHPAYEGNVMHPMVSLPRPQPRVKLPPALAAAQGAQPTQAPPPFTWANPGSFSNAARAPPPAVSANAAPAGSRATSSSQADWQNRFNSLLHTGKALSPPKAMGIDPASRNALDHSLQPDSATVSLPGKPVFRQQTEDPKSTITKPMAEECFEEQEMGSLPQIKIPHDIPEAAWHPAPEQTRPFPKRFWVQPTNSEPFYFSPDVTSGNLVLKVCVPGMKEQKTVPMPSSMARSSRGGHGRPGPRHRGSSGRGGKRDISSPRPDRDPAAEPTRGRGRGSYRSRGSDNWGRQASSQQASVST